jgi:uncharacterized protein with PQ loop repeat
MLHLAHQKYRKNQKNRSLINRLVLIMAIVEPLMTLPQVYEIWIKQQRAGVSTLTWTFFTMAAVTWLIYGLKIKNSPLIISSTLWIIVEGSVVIGLLVR